MAVSDRKLDALIERALNDHDKSCKRLRRFDESVLSYGHKITEGEFLPARKAFEAITEAEDNFRHELFMVKKRRKEQAK